MCLLQGLRPEFSSVALPDIVPELRGELCQLGSSSSTLDILKEIGKGLLAFWPFQCLTLWSPGPAGG